MTAPLLAPRPHQLAVLADLVPAFAVHDRVQIHIASGAGKTLTARWHAAASGARQVLVMVPSLALLAQTLREWRRDRLWPFDALVVCSDPSTAAGAAERGLLGDGDDVEDVPDWASVRAQVTTNPNVASAFLTRRRDDGRAAVVFSTYHSAPVVAAAQRISTTSFGLVVCDEAHHLSGSPRAEFATVLDARQIVARKRLFMTATPRLDGERSMSDPRLFGPVAHTVSFAAAIRAGLLCDYQVLIVAGPAEDGQMAELDPSAAVPAALVAAVDQHGVRRVLTFHNRVARAASFAHAVDGYVTPGGHQVGARHVSGAQPTQDRSAALAWLGRPAEEVRVLSNARVLTEGVDVPSVDAVLFADRRTSPVEILQGIGRALRTSPGKRVGTIVVPVSLDATDDDTDLLLSKFSTLWTVLRGLRAHDQRFATEIDGATRAAVQHGRGHGYFPQRLKFVLPGGVDEDSVQLRLVQEVGDAWEKFYATCKMWAIGHPGRRLPRATSHAGLPIGEWSARQRSAHHAGVLPADRARRLEDLPGWFWDRVDAAWDDTYAVVAAFADAHGTVAEADRGESLFKGLKASHGDGRQLGLWLAAQRQSYRAGLLDPARADLLDRLPGWTWTPLDPTDQAMVDALGQYCDFEGHADVPADHVEDGLDLGRWVWTVRRRKLTGVLPPALEDAIWGVTPSRWAPGSNLRWNWRKPDAQWRLAYTALRVYADREGNAQPPAGHTEVLSDAAVRIGQWVVLQRHTHRRGELAADRVAALERMPGWSWEGNIGGAKPFDDPIGLPAGLEHGRAGAIARGCKCQVCGTARRSSNRDWLARKREQRLAGGIPSGPARRHLQQLEAQLRQTLGAERNQGWRRLVSSTSGVPMSVVRGLADGVPLVDRAHAARLLATTADMCRSQIRSGSRGRPVQADQQRVDGAPTHAFLADLAGRGFSLGWIGRELGYARAMHLTGDTVTRQLADQIADLHHAVDGLHPPPCKHGQMLPRLALLRSGKVA